MIPGVGLVLIALAMGGCQGHRWRSVAAGSALGPPASGRLSGPSVPALITPQDQPDEPLLIREGDAAVLTFHKCRVKMDLVDAKHAEVSNGQTCAMVVNGYNTKLAIKGTATYESADTFYAEITGTPTEAGVEGEYVWRFSGTRKS